eukprot:TRINITY_DN31203_c0_g1_i1.p1 TRINITY_DN31203_c0_g1~~TRINITY_DN31203_c0_g1_i1.p1  ORF type:complete len:493 (+),score=89.79 TRINITY_DN31203_c0_g1_i1:105-1481(+)
MSQKNNILKLFRQYDPKNTGTMPAEVFRSLLTALDPSFTSEELEDVIAKVPQKEDGQLSYESFVSRVMDEITLVYWAAGKNFCGRSLAAKMSLAQAGVAHLYKAPDEVEAPATRFPPKLMTLSGVSVSQATSIAYMLGLQLNMWPTDRYLKYKAVQYCLDAMDWIAEDGSATEERVECWKAHYEDALKMSEGDFMLGKTVTTCDFVMLMACVLAEGEAHYYNPIDKTRYPNWKFATQRETDVRPTKKDIAKRVTALQALSKFKKYALVYHDAGKPFVGRSWGLMMILEEAGAQYEYKAVEDVEVPVTFAPPMIITPKGVGVSQQCAIAMVLGEELNLWPTEPARSAKALQYCGDGADFYADVSDAKSEGLIDGWLQVYEESLEISKGKFMLGNSLSACDYIRLVPCLLLEGPADNRTPIDMDKYPKTVVWMNLMKQQKGYEAAAAAGLSPKPGGWKYD